MYGPAPPSAASTTNSTSSGHSSPSASGEAENLAHVPQLLEIARELEQTALADDYSDTIVARNKRDYVWIMARTPTLPEARYRQLVAEVAAMGYDTSRLRRVPQQWPEPAPRPPLR